VKPLRRVPLLELDKLKIKTNKYNLIVTLALVPVKKQFAILLHCLCKIVKPYIHTMANTITMEMQNNIFL
jgi:hypothetical protein